jgi:hypothetical protein
VSGVRTVGLADCHVRDRALDQLLLGPQQAMFVARAEHHHDRITDVAIAE